MERSRRVRLADLTRILRSRVTRTAYYGLAIAVVAVALATMGNAYMLGGRATLVALGEVQTTRPTLWLLDLMPLVFLLWGQYVGVVVSTEAGALVLDETETLRGDNAALAAEAERSHSLDSLTGLSSRGHFVDQLEHAIVAADMDSTQLGVIVVDLDGFSEINQHYGPANGDRVLITVARRLKRVMPQTATLGRLNADRFSLFLQPFHEDEELESIASAMLQALKPKCRLDGVSVSLAASAGGARYPADANEAYALLDAAEQAMQQVKVRGGGFEMFYSRRAAPGVAMHSLSAELRRAIDADEFVLYLQPLIDISDSTVYGVEALVRWQHPRRGLIMPDEFITRAERSGLMQDLTLWVLRSAISHIAAIRRVGPRLRISVNMPARALLRANFPDILRDLLAEQSVPGSAITLEITEDTLMADQNRTLEIIERLVGMGIELSIDDFGIGYSQLAYLKRLPVAEIKIDRSFIEDMLISDTDRAIVAATISLAHALNLRAVGEGVESAEQLDQLRALGCDLVQGFHVGRPMPVACFHEWLDHWPAPSPGDFGAV